MRNRSYANAIIAIAYFVCEASMPACGGWLDPRFDLAGANGGIGALVEFQGTLYVSGGFTRIGGVNARGTARWNGSQWAAFRPDIGMDVWPILASDEVMYLLGRAAGDVSQPIELVRWDGHNWTRLGLPTGYRTLSTPALLVNAEDVYLSAYPEPGPKGLNAKKVLARWNGNSWSIAAETSYLGGVGLLSLAAAQGVIYGSGVLGSQSLNVGRLEPPNWLRVGGGVDYGISVFDIASDGTYLFIQGQFAVAGSQPADGFAVWDRANWFTPPAGLRDGARVEALTSNPGEVLASEVIRTNASVSQYLVQYKGTNRVVLARGDASGMELMRRARNGVVYCAGGFPGVGGLHARNFAVWNGSNWARVGEGVFRGLSGPATCLAVWRTNVYVGGSFEFAGDVAAKHVARWDGSRWHALGPGIDGVVSQLAACGEELFAIGKFVSTSGSSATNIVKWNGIEWSSVGNGLVGVIRAIAATDCEVYVARTLSNENPNFFISRWNGTNWMDIAEGEAEYRPIPINTMVVTDNSVIIGGRFRSINGNEVNNIAQLVDGQWKPLGAGVSGEREWIPNDYPFAEVRALLSDGSNLFVGGSFTNASGVTAMNIARWDGSEWHALGSGLPGFGACSFGSCLYPVTSMALLQGNLFVGGGFSDGPHDFLARWDGVEWRNVFDRNWGNDWGQPYSNPGRLHVWALASCGTDLYFAGNFTTVDSTPSHGFGIWHEGHAPTLRAKLNAGHLTLWWPRQFQNAFLESAGALAGGPWIPVPGVNPQISQSDSSAFEVRLVPAMSPSFYRLRWE